MRSISIPAIVWVPVVVWFVTYELTKYHGWRGFIKEFFDFDM